MRIFAKVENIALNKLLKHLWHLSEGLIALSLFNAKVSTKIRKKIVISIIDGLAEMENLNAHLQRRLQFQRHQFPTASYKTLQRGGQFLFFQKFNINTPFLHTDTERW